MIRPRAISAAVTTGFLLLAMVISALFAFQVASGAIYPLSEAHRCALDWEEGIAAVEAGATEYQGVCVSFGGVLSEEGVPPDFYDQLAEYRRRVAAELEELTGDVWRSAGNRMGGFPLVFFSLLVGAYLAGSTLASGTAAWSLSNGWTRQTWIGSLVALTLILIAAAYLVFTGVFIAGVLLQVNGLGLTASLDLPGPSYLIPLPGLLFYGLVGIGAGLLTGRDGVGMMIAFIFAITDFVVANTLELLPAVPSSFHQAAVGGEMARVSGTTGALTLMGAAVVLAVGLHFYFVRRRDVPDR